MSKQKWQKEDWFIEIQLNKTTVASIDVVGIYDVGVDAGIWLSIGEYGSAESVFIDYIKSNMPTQEEREEDLKKQALNVLLNHFGECTKTIQSLLNQ